YQGFVIFTLSKSKPVPRLYSLCAPKSVTSGRMKFCAAKNFPLPGTCEVLACGAAHACCRCRKAGLSTDRGSCASRYESAIGPLIGPADRSDILPVSVRLVLACPIQNSNEHSGVREA